jgi:hypothetical protein
MSIRVYRPLSLEVGPPYRPLTFEVGAGYYHAERFVRDNNLEFWANPIDIKYVGRFVDEVRVDERVCSGAIFALGSVEHFIKYDESGTMCFMREPFPE